MSRPENGNDGSALASRELVGASMKRRLAIIVVLSLYPSLATAEQPAEKSGRDRSLAQALFYEARGLVKKGRYAEACPKLEESLRLDHGIGTAYNLADCNERLGKLATAWSGFLDVATAARAAGQTLREKVARERAERLEGRLPKMVVDVRSAPRGLVVKRDGVVVGPALLGTPLPVDPGTHAITATAPGRATFETSLEAAEGKTARVVVKELPPTPPPPVVATTPPASGATGAAAPGGAPIRGVSTTTITSATPTGSGENIATTFPEPVVERDSPQRTIGWVVGGLGVAGLGVGTAFGLTSMSDRNEARDHCSGDVCDPTGVRLRDDAVRNGDISTLAMIAGGAAVVGGLVLVLTAPREERRISGLPSGPRIGRVSASPQMGPTSAGFVIGGALP